MAQETAVMWETPPAPASKAPGSVGPGDVPQVRTLRKEEEPWSASGVRSKERVPEHATGHSLDVVA